jgi:hypothetical protein
MTARSAHFDIYSQPGKWPALLSLLALLVLVLSPLCRCAMAEASPDHSHSHSAVAGHAHEAASEDHHDDRGAAHHKDDQIALSPVPQSHICCCESSVPPVVLATLPHSAAPDASSWMPVFTPATLPVRQEVFALTGCHGRDGPPPDKPLRSQFLSSSLLGRAPPVSV